MELIQEHTVSNIDSAGKGGSARHCDQVTESESKPAAMMRPLHSEPSQSARVLTGRDMLCFSHDWTGDPLSKTHLMRLLARDNRILWVNSIGYRTPSLGKKRDLQRIIQKVKAAAEPVQEVEKNIFVLNPLFIPAFGNSILRGLSSRLLRWQLIRAMRKLRFRDPINWVFNPAAGLLAGQLGEDKLVYYCVDEYSAFAGIDTAALAAIERRLIQRADLVIVSAEKLLHSKRSPHAPTLLVRHGVDYDHFAGALDPGTIIPDEIARLPKPVIGYFGLIADDWVDVPLLIHVARQFPTASLVMLGKVTMDISSLAREPNVVLLGQKPYSSLPAYSKGFDVAIIPLPINEVTVHANPLKAREYLAAGLPVVSTPIPEVEFLGKCHIGASPEEFCRRIREALLSPGPDPVRSSSMRRESWAARVEEIRRHWPEPFSPG
jgi:glycosyltransferase involved in cell wall biosynthesis